MTLTKLGRFSLGLICSFALTGCAATQVAPTPHQVSLTAVPTRTDSPSFCADLPALPTDSARLSHARLCGELSKLQEEVANLRATNAALGPISRFLAVWVPVISAGLAVMIAFLLNRTINSAQHDKLTQEKELAVERHLLDVSKELGNESVGVRAAAIATLVQRLTRIRRLLEPLNGDKPNESERPSAWQRPFGAPNGDKRKAGQCTSLLEEQATIVGLLIQASKHEDDESAQKYIGDGIASALGAMPSADEKADEKKNMTSEGKAEPSPLNTFDFQGARFTNVWWKGINANGVDFYGAMLPRAGLRAAILNRAILKNANLTGATLARATLVKANLSGADLTGADLRGAKLQGTDFTNAILKGARFDATDLSEAILTDARVRPQDVQSMKLTDDQRASLRIEQNPP